MIGLVIDRAAETTDLEILDARDFEGPPVARIRVPHRIPPGFPRQLAAHVTHRGEALHQKSHDGRVGSLTWRN